MHLHLNVQGGFKFSCKSAAQYGGTSAGPAMAISPSAPRNRLICRRFFLHVLGDDVVKVNVLENQREEKLPNSSISTEMWAVY